MNPRFFAVCVVVVLLTLSFGGILQAGTIDVWQAYDERRFRAGK